MKGLGESHLVCALMSQICRSFLTVFAIEHLFAVNVNEEHRDVVFLDLLLYGMFGVGDSTILVLGVAFEMESARSMEGDRCARLAFHGSCAFQISTYNPFRGY